MSTDEAELQVRSQYIKRRKHFRACEFCRRRKVACDAADREDNRCSMCITHGMECQYDPAAKLKRPSRRYIEALETRLSKMEDLLKKLQADAALTADDAEHLNDTLKPQQPPSVAKHPHSTWSSFKVIYPRGAHPSTDSSEEVDPSDDEEGIAVTDVKFRGYTGKSSNFNLVRTVMDLKSEHNGASSDVEFQKRLSPDILAMGTTLCSGVPSFREQDFPPPDVMADLVDFYFAHLNAYLPILHRPTFERDLADGLHLRDRGFGTVVLLVCATGSAWAHGTSHSVGGESSYQAPGWQWFDRVSMTQFSVLAPPGLYDVQACALMAAYINTTNSPQVTLPVLSLGIRMAQDAGAHRKKMYSATPTVEQELWKRAWWALIAMDRLASFGMGRQCTIQDEDFDVDPMTECDDEYWLHPDPSQAFRQPPGKPSKVAFCNAFIRLLKIEAFASRTIFTTNKSKLSLGYFGPEWKQRIVADLDSSMNKWFDTIPSHLRWDPNCEDVLILNQSAILYANYYQLQIFVHRPFIPSPRRRLANANLSLPSMTICVNAARACLRVLEVQHRRAMAMRSGFTLYALTPLQMPLFTVGIMLLVYLWGGARDAHATLEDVNVCLSILTELSEAGNLAARKLWTLLIALSPIAQHEPSAPEQPPSSSTLAQEGPKTIDELIAAAMQQLALSGFRVADGSYPFEFPTDSATSRPPAPGTSTPFHSSHSHSKEKGREKEKGKEKEKLFEPSPFVKGGSVLDPSADAPTASRGRNMDARELGAFGTTFVPASGSHPNQSHTTNVNMNVNMSGNGNGNGAAPPPPPLAFRSSFGSVPVPPARGEGGARELDFAFGNALMADDLDFFDSLSSMFGSGTAQDRSLPPRAAPEWFAPQHPPPQSQATTTTMTMPYVAVADPLQFPATVPNASSSSDLRELRPWQWTPAPRSELWDRSGAYFYDQLEGGVASAAQPPE